MTARVLPALALLVLSTAGCTAAETPTPQYAAQARGDGWATATPAEEGMDPRALAELGRSIRDDSRGDLRSVVIARHGRLVFEGYFNGAGPDSLHDIRSATKSLTSALVGIAIADGLIAGTKAPAMALLPAAASPPDNDPRKQAITVEHLLMMASGLAANDDDPATPGSEDRLWQASDWVAFARGIPMTAAPGTRWDYAAVNTFILGVIIEEASGMRLSDFARDRFFTPLGIARYRWRTNPAGRTVGQGNLSLRARDMAKVGQLYLDGGRWAGSQVVPEGWVRASLEPRYAVPWPGYGSYGYGWYISTTTVNGREFRYFFASGNGGNKIYVVPDEGLVVAIQSAAYNTGYGQRRSLDLFRQVLAGVPAGS